MELSPKQTEFINSKHGRINILSGAVRSGKTYVSLFYWMLFILGRPRNYEYLMVGRTLTSLKRNCLGIMIDLSPGLFSYSASQKKAVFAGRTIWLEGANDERAETKIRGMTLGGAYIDEATLMPQDFFKMLLTRLSLKGARLYATTNPDAPTHWLKTEYMDNPDVTDKAIFIFNIDDNPVQDAEYVENLKKEFAGVFYKRFILGEWILAEGRIYDMFSGSNIYTDADRPLGLKYIAARRVSVDYGTTNPCTYLDIYDDGVTLWVDNQYWWDSRKEMRQKTDAEYVADMQNFFGGESSAVVCDPSAASFITALKQDGVYVTPADNDVINGIRAVSTMLSKRNIRVHQDRCRNLILELQEYCWDDKATLRGEEAPLKTRDHGCDALRYYVNTVVSKWRKGLT